MRYRHNAGQTLVEMLVAIGIAAVMLPALATAIFASSQGHAQEPQRVQATGLLREATEIVRSVREKGWASFAVNGTYHPAVSGNGWTLSAGSETISGFTRQVVIADAQRNGSGAVVTSGGTADGSTKKVTVSVSWTSPIASTISSDMYFQRYLGNAAWAQTTFSGTFVNTAATGGSADVVLAAGPAVPDWTTPSIAGSYDTAGNQDALDVFTAGNYAYICDGSVLTIVNITTPTSPTLVGTYSASSTVNHVYVDGNYAYLSTVSNTTELQILNITTPSSPSLVASVNLPGNGDALASFVTGGYAYVGRVVDATSGNNEFYIVNVSTPASPTTLGSVNFTGNINNIKVSGNYAYLATAMGTQEMTVVDVTNKNAPSQAATYNVPGTAVANDLGLDGTTLYLALANNTSGAEMYSVSVATPTSPSQLGSYEVGGAVTGVSALNGYAFLSTAISTKQLIALSVSTPSSPTLKSNVNLGSSANDVKASGIYAFVATASNSQELMVVAPAMVSSGYQTSGTYQSTTFDATASAAFNYLTFTATKPAGTNVQLQIATNNDNATWNYLGPDGTAATYYTAAGTIRYNVTGRYIRYKVTLTGPGTSTPTFSDISINYSP